MFLRRLSRRRLVPHNTSLQWTHGNVTHFARRKMRAITVRH
jgi:hypothetical protein